MERFTKLAHITVRFLNGLLCDWWEVEERRPQWQSIGIDWWRPKVPTWSPHWSGFRWSAHLNVAHSSSACPRRDWSPSSPGPRRMLGLVHLAIAVIPLRFLVLWVRQERADEYQFWPHRQLQRWWLWQVRPFRLPLLRAPGRGCCPCTCAGKQICVVPEGGQWMVTMTTAPLIPALCSINSVKKKKIK